MYKQNKIKKQYSMKFKLPLLGLIFLTIISVFFINSNTDEVDLAKEKHQAFIDNHPYQKSLKLTKAERKAEGNVLGAKPPNKYFEQEYLLEMNPNTGETEPEKLFALQESLRNNQQRTPGSTAATAWIERGPDNVPGRTRAIMYDPNDATHKRVFAGGVSGGLWVIDDIENASSVWQRIGIPENLAVSSITVDINDSNVFYVGTGESYTQGGVNGNGVWKSIDGGATWVHIFGGSTGTTSVTGSSTLIPGKFHVNDIITRNNNGVTEVYAAISESRHTSNDYTLGGEFGLYKSIDGGVTWALLTMPLNTGGHHYEPNDLEITLDNTLWVATTNSFSYGDGGGTVLSSTDGITFTVKFNDVDGRRTQIAVSATDSNKIYVLMNTGSSAGASIALYKTISGFNSTTTLTKPNDGILPNPSDFTGSQAYYNLTLSVDPNNDDKVNLGGINTFKSINGGTSWQKTSVSRSTSSTLSEIHADVHTIVYHPTNSNKGLIGTDGGVYYVNSFSTAHNNTNAMVSRGNSYNTTQFYKGAIGQNAFSDQFLGGAQDNGTNFMDGATPGINSSTEVAGGDGMYCFIDKGGQYMISSYINNTYYRRSMTGAYETTIVSNQQEGNFVNVAELDDNLNILFTDAHTRSGSTVTAKISRFVNVNATPTRTNLTNSLLTRPVSALKVSPFSSASSTLFVGTDRGDIYKIISANSNPAWSDLTPAFSVSPFKGSISAISFGASESEIMVTFHNYGVVSVYFTEDAGITWQNKEGNLPDLPVKDILMNPLLNDEVIIATALGVWKTSNFKDANPNWTQSQNGMQNVKVTSLELRTLDKTVLASTYGRGFFTGRFTADVAATNDASVITKKLVVYPTVSNGEFTISSTHSVGDINVSIVDVNGKEVYKSKLNISDKEHISLNVSQGIYFVNFKGNSIKESHKIIVK